MMRPPPLKSVSGLLVLSGRLLMSDSMTISGSALYIQESYLETSAGFMACSPELVL